MKNCLLVFILLPAFFPAAAQVPFVCRGDFYLALGPGSGFSTIYSLEVDGAGNAFFEPISAGDSGQSLNGMGYRTTDNLMYAVHSNSLELYRIDATGAAESLGFPSGNIPPGYDFYTGDITPDGHYLVIIGSQFDVNELIIKIDLRTAGYPITITPLSGPDVNCADIAFDPKTGTIYGFDAIGNRLVKFNLDYSEVTTPYASFPDGGIMGAIFFDAFSNLWGYGQQKEDNSQRTLFRFNITTGEVTVETTGPDAARNDGCSCPYTIKLREWTDVTTAVPCSRVPLVIEITNASDGIKTGLRLKHEFPEEFRIVSIHDPLNGHLAEGGPGFNHFAIDRLDVPLGNYKILVELELLPQALGSYLLQSELSLLPDYLGGRTLSDNPLTLQPEDPVVLKVIPLVVDFSQTSTILCPGQEILLAPGIPGVSYHWSDGSTAPDLAVTEVGHYAVTVVSGCDTAIAEITVGDIELGIELGPDLTIPLGDSLELAPTVYPAGGQVSYHWESSGGGSLLTCTHCETLRATPFNDITYYLTVANDSGCVTGDSIRIKVDKTRFIYIPTAFSPNGDGFNDRFYIDGKSQEELVRLLIFDRWGDLVFQQSGGLTGDATAGWDGRIKGAFAPGGMYVYLAEIRFLDGAVERFAGGVAVVR